MLFDANTYTCVRAYTRTLMHAHACARVRTRTHARMRAHVHTLKGKKTLKNILCIS